jgi:hypothetical protein
MHSKPSAEDTNLAFLFDLFTFFTGQFKKAIGTKTGNRAKKIVASCREMHQTPSKASS